MEKSAAAKKMHEAKDYLISALGNFRDSFKNLDRTILFIVAYKLVFYIASILLILNLRNIILKKGEPLLGIDPEILRMGQGPELAALSESVRSFYSQITMYAVLFCILILALHIAANFLIWAAITGKRIRKVKPCFALRFFAMNILWVALWAFLAAIAFMSIRPEVFFKWAFGIVLVYSHFTAVVYISYFKGSRAARSLKKAADVGINKIQHFIVPYALAGLIFLALNIALAPLSRLTMFSGRLTASYAAVFIVFLLYAAWLRIYIYSFAKKLV